MTLDSPEHPNLAHIMVSDGPAHQCEPIEHFTIYTHEELDRLIEQIVRPWREPARREGVSRKGSYGA